MSLIIKYVWVFNEHQVLKTLREKCSDTEFFWYVFSCIRTEYGDVFSGPYFPVYGLNTETFCLVHIFLYSGWIRRCFFWSEYRKIRTRKNSVFRHFSRSERVNVCQKNEKRNTKNLASWTCILQWMLARSTSEKVSENVYSKLTI